MHVHTVTTVFPASNELLNRHWTALHWTKYASTSVRSVITIMPTWRERVHWRLRQRYEMTSGWNRKQCWQTDYVFYTVTGTVTLDPLGSAYRSRTTSHIEGFQLQKLTNGGIGTSKEATVNWFWRGRGEGVVVRSEPIFNSYSVTAEIGLVTHSSAHVNEGHGWGMVCPYTI